MKYVIETHNSTYVVQKHHGFWYAYNTKDPSKQYICVGFIDQRYQQVKPIEGTIFVSPLPPLAHPDGLEKRKFRRGFEHHTSMLFMEIDKYNHVMHKFQGREHELFSQLVYLANKTSPIKHIEVKKD